MSQTEKMNIQQGIKRRWDKNEEFTDHFKLEAAEGNRHGLEFHIRLFLQVVSNQLLLSAYTLEDT